MPACAGIFGLLMTGFRGASDTNTGGLTLQAALI
jgi:hypothetical protein